MCVSSHANGKIPCYITDILLDANEMEIERAKVAVEETSNEKCGCGSKTVLKLILPKSRTGTEEDVEVGPIPVHTNDSIATIESRIKVRGREAYLYLFCCPLYGFIPCCGSNFIEWCYWLDDANEWAFQLCTG